MKILNLFKKEAFLSDKGIKVYDKIITKPKSVKETIEEIHENFYTEVNKLLIEAKISKSIDTDKEDLIQKSKRLKSLGFTNTKEVIEANAELQRINLLKEENSKNQNLVEAIDYFSFKYPQYKFITEESIKKICSKYNLVYATIDRYIGTVPDKNLKHIEEFKIKEEDICYQITNISIYSSTNAIEYCDKTKLDKELQSYKDYRRHSSYSSKSFDKAPLEIAAPISDFNMSEYEVKDFKLSKIHIPDPVLLQPVYFKANKYYLIITAWGLESSDELIINEKMN